MGKRLIKLSKDVAEILLEIHAATKDKSLAECLNDEDCLSAWNKWFSLAKGAELEEFDRILIRDLDLSGLKLSNAVLRKIRFENVNLSNALIDGSDLIHVHFLNCDAAGLALIRSGGRFIAFENCKLNDSVFRTFKARDVDFHKCDAEDSRFEGCQFQGSALWNSSFISATFTNGIEFNSGRIANCDFTASRFVADSRNHQTVNTTRIINLLIDKTSFMGAAISSASFLSSEIEGCDFSGADLSGSFLPQGGFDNCNLESVDFQGVSMSAKNPLGMSGGPRGNLGKDLGLKLEGGPFSKAHFRNCKISGANFAGAKLDKYKNGGFFDAPPSKELFYNCEGLPFGVEGLEE